MEPIFVVACGAMMTASIYLLLSRNVLRVVLGLLLISNAVNLSIFTAGRVGSMVPPIVPVDEVPPAVMANPLPQALILTAIVISFALTAFAVVLFERAHRSLGTLDTEEMREVEPHMTAPADKGAA